MRCPCRDLASQEAAIQDKLAQYTEQRASDAAAHAAVRTLAARANQPDPPLPLTPGVFQPPGHAAADLKVHPFFRECMGACAARDVDYLEAPQEGAVQMDSDDEEFPAVMHAAFRCLHERSSALKQYLQTSVRNATLVLLGVLEN